MKTQRGSPQFKPKRITSLVRARTGGAGGFAQNQAEADAASDIQARLRELIKLAKEQGYLTFDDLNEALPEE